MSENNKSTVGDAIGNVLGFLFKAFLKMVVLILLSTAKLFHAVLGLIIEFIEKRLD